MQKEIDHLEEHVVICGFGRMGKLLAEQLHKANYPFLIIDQDRQKIESIKEQGYIFIEGDATEESTLQQASIEKASIVATVLPSDAMNVFIVLSCRALNKKLTIVSRANQLSAEAKLIQAGTDKVIMPAAIGADRMANLILKPNTTQILEKDLNDNIFIDSLSEIGLGMEEIPVEPCSELVGTSLAEVHAKKDFSYLIVAIRKANGESTTKPSPQTIIEKGDTLIVMCYEGIVPHFTRCSDIRNASTISAH